MEVSGKDNYMSLPNFGRVFTLVNINALANTRTYRLRQFTFSSEVFTRALIPMCFLCKKG